MTERKIILGYDPEHGGDDVLGLGRLMAETLDAKPLVVTAMPWPPYLTDSVELDKALAQQMRDRFAAARDELRGLSPETRVIASGHTASTLHKVADDVGAELIVIGSSHRGPLGRTLAGSVGESLLHGSSSAVMVAPRGYGNDPGVRLQKIGVAFDGSPESWTALETAVGMAERCHASLTVITVADYPTYGYAAAWTVLSAGELTDPEREDKERLVELAVNRIAALVPHESRVLTGDPGTVLAEASEEFDVMVAGSRSWGPLKRTLLGSATRTLIRSCACPVLVLPRGAGIDPLGIRDARPEFQGQL